MNKELIKKEFLESTQTWVENFNKGNVQYCIDAYTDNARMIVKGIGKFEGKEEIANPVNTDCFMNFLLFLFIIFFIFPPFNN